MMLLWRRSYEAPLQRGRKITSYFRKASMTKGASIWKMELSRNPCALLPLLSHDTPWLTDFSGKGLLYIFLNPLGDFEQGQETKPISSGEGGW